MQSVPQSECQQSPFITMFKRGNSKHLMLLLLTIFMMANAYFAHYTTLNHPSFTELAAKVTYILTSTLGLPFIAVVISVCLPKFCRPSSYVKVLLVSSGIVFLSNLPLMALVINNI